MAALVLQTIDGTFVGRLPGIEKPFVEIESVEGGFWVVRTNSEDVALGITSRFKDVREEETRS
ncbi:MAG TPA: hypothetical protein VI893_09690 [Thermoplasmata archaeon]|nr:hypothetical protein [Thermoplasmata archaeon]